MTEREKMAQVIAYITSGIEDARPEQDDFDLADKTIAFVETQLNRKE